jgi:hypothetical protein
MNVVVRRRSQYRQANFSQRSQFAPQYRQASSSQYTQPVVLFTMADVESAYFEESSDPNDPTYRRRNKFGLVSIVKKGLRKTKKVVIGDTAEGLATRAAVAGGAVGAFLLRRRIGSGLGTARNFLGEQAGKAGGFAGRQWDRAVGAAGKMGDRISGAASGARQAVGDRMTRRPGGYRGGGAGAIEQVRPSYPRPQLKALPAAKGTYGFSSQPRIVTFSRR